MADLMAVISKAVFDKLAKALGPGDVLEIDRYTSTNKALTPLGEAGARLFLFTVRPPDEELWLVAVLSDLALAGDAWVGSANTTPITDIAKLKSKIQFASGVGIKAKPGALGMSLQTPRALTEGDVELLLAAAGAKRSAKPAATKPAKATAPKANGKPKKLGDIRGPFAFQNRREFKAPALLKLDPAHQQQFVLQAQSYMGTNAKTVQACVQEICENNGWTLGDFSIELWDIVTKGQPDPVFEYWVLGAGDGEVFWAGEARPTAVQSVQHDFQSLEEDAASHALAAALQAVAPS